MEVLNGIAEQHGDDHCGYLEFEVAGHGRPFALRDESTIPRLRHGYADRERERCQMPLAPPYATEPQAVTPVQTGYMGNRCAEYIGNTSTSPSGTPLGSGV